MWNAVCIALRRQTEITIDNGALYMTVESEFEVILGVVLKQDAARGGAWLQRAVSWRW